MPTGMCSGSSCVVEAQREGPQKKQLPATRVLGTAAAVWPSGWKLPPPSHPPTGRSLGDKAAACNAPTLQETLLGLPRAPPPAMLTTAGERERTSKPPVTDGKSEAERGHTAVNGRAQPCPWVWVLPILLQVQMRVRTDSSIRSAQPGGEAHGAGRPQPQTAPPKDVRRKTGTAAPAPTAETRAWGRDWSVNR